MKALLYTTEGTWTLEPLHPSVGVGRQFATAADARAWAKSQRIKVRRAPDCDSTTVNIPTINSLIRYVWDTRQFGVTYVHKSIRNAVQPWQGCIGTLDGRTVRATYGSWGRSLQSRRGHKFKAWMRFEDTGKPVPTSRLRDVQPSQVAPIL